MMKTALSYLLYPAGMAAALTTFFAMRAAGLPLVAATYVPIVAVALLVLVAETKLPARTEWRPRAADMHSDALFMALVQVALPYLLFTGAIILLAQWFESRAPWQAWPADWPLLAQILCMVLLVDLLRYWLHRACHAYIPLWRFHEVHHSPDILYALNVGRFHPVEKALHFSLDTLPFLLLGAGPEVLAGYALLYSVNGFFQHCNVDLRYGWLNYVVGSAETHRWHHARDPRTAACNFSNTTIFWDLLFRTWYLPRGKRVEIGILDREYPQTFFGQMLSPFRRRDDGPRRSLQRHFADLLLRASLNWTLFIDRLHLRRAARDPARMQRRLLRRILRENEFTAFGARHDFRGAKTYEDFRARIPVQEYDALRADIEMEIRGGLAALTKEPPMRYVRTSGTTGRAKDIPLVATHLRALKNLQRRSLAYQFRACPDAFDGSILAIVSPAIEGRLENGKIFGSASGVLVGSSPAAIKEKFAVPAEVFDIDDSYVKYLLILRLALARADLTYLGSANPSTMLALVRIYREHQLPLIRDLEEGGFHLQDRLSDNVRLAVESRLQPDPQRAAYLARIALRPTPASIGDLWPQLKIVITWTGGSAGVSAKRLRTELKPGTRMMELGYVASEFRGTLTLGKPSGMGIPTLETHFFEFVERDRWDAGEPEFLLLDQLRKGVDYYLVTTTPSGLYRYFINDLLRVSGRIGRLPLLRFVQKGKGVTNITGEKLYEAQVLQAVRTVNSRAAIDTGFYILLADEEAAGYTLYIEAKPHRHLENLAESFDAELRQDNVEYAAKRESGRLAPLALRWLREGCAEAFKHHCVAAGQREGQFKPTVLAYRKGIAFDFDAWLARMKLESLDVHSLAIPFTSSVRHASAERQTTQAVWVSVRSGGLSGHGEGCPREYVTAEDLGGALAFCDAYREEWLEEIRGLEDLRRWVAGNALEIDRHPAAWCAVELALLDLFARGEGCSVETLLGLSSLRGDFVYSAILGDVEPESFAAHLQYYRSQNFRSYKMKLSGDFARDRAKVDILSKAGIRVRADANNLWADAGTAADYLLALEYDFTAVEEPLQSRDFEGMRALAERLSCPLILDESLTKKADLNRLDDPQRWICNLRISKLGGLLRSFDVLASAQALGTRVVVGAHVGETSLLTRAALPLARAAAASLYAQEGGFGTHLLERDVVAHSLRFTEGGCLRIAPERGALPGWGLQILPDLA
jgi:sterol desaturase/sphingolipid hydroxylase (fatty acid hydroxylase superfamily)/L-alanine-DL-glutamate epimerase-like enolase superfamily enzyme